MRKKTRTKRSPYLCPFHIYIAFAIIGFDAALELFPPFIDADFYSYVVDRGGNGCMHIIYIIYTYILISRFATHVCASFKAPRVH